MVPALKDSVLYDPDSDSLVITSNAALTKDKQTTRCREKLNDELLKTARDILKWETLSGSSIVQQLQQATLITAKYIHTTSIIQTAADHVQQRRRSTSFEPPTKNCPITRDQFRALKRPVSIDQIKYSGAGVQEIRNAKKWNKQRRRLLGQARIKR